MLEEKLLIDSNILVDYLRVRKEAIEFLDEIKSPRISVITVSELYAGVREGLERTALTRLVNELEVIDVTEEIARKGGLYLRDYRKSHGVGLGDAIIAATAASGDLQLVTLNRKHFPMLSDIVTPYVRT